MTKQVDDIFAGMPLVTRAVTAIHQANNAELNDIIDAVKTFKKPKKGLPNILVLKNPIHAKSINIAIDLILLAPRIFCSFPFGLHCGRKRKLCGSLCGS